MTMIILQTDKISADKRVNNASDYFTDCLKIKKYKKRMYYAVCGDMLNELLLKRVLKNVYKQIRYKETFDAIPKELKEQGKKFGTKCSFIMGIITTKGRYVFNSKEGALQTLVSGHYTIGWNQAVVGVLLSNGASLEEIYKHCSLYSSGVGEEFVTRHSEDLEDVCPIQ